MSTATIRLAPAITAPWMQLSPTPPQPITATLAPGGTLAVRITAPTPVGTAHPTMAARSRGMSGSIFTRAFSWTSISSAKVARPDELHARFPAGESQTAARLVGRPRQTVLPAQGRASGQAPLALPAEPGRKGDDVVPRLHVGDVGADGLHDPRALVTQDGRTLRADTAVAGSANRCGTDRSRPPGS